MNSFKLVFSILMFSSGPVALSQGGKNPQPISPGLLAKHERAADAISKGAQFLRARDLDAAIASFRQAVEIERTYGYFASRGSYELAKALTAAGRTEEALDAYKRAVSWDPVKKELDINGPPHIRVATDYAVLLARTGRSEDAKAIYYFALRSFNSNAEGDKEQLPFLIVFDQDQTMTSWQYSRERLIAAATLVRAADDDQRALFEGVRRQASDWAIPALYLALRSPVAEQPGLMSVAASLATGEERDWIGQYENLLTIEDSLERHHAAKQIAKQMAEIGLARRKASTVLAKAKADLEESWSRIAIEHY